MSDDMCLLHLPGHMYVPPKELLPLPQERKGNTESRPKRTSATKGKSRMVDPESDGFERSEWEDDRPGRSTSFG